MEEDQEDIPDFDQHSKVNDDAAADFEPSTTQHDPERGYICNNCDKFFTRKCNLDRHVASVHKWTAVFEPTSTQKQDKSQ